MQLTYLDRWHFFNATIMPKEPIVVKVGVDGFADLVRLRVLYPKARIIAYEADPVNFQRQAKIGENGICEFVNEAVGTNGPVTLYRFKNHVSNSVHARHLKEKQCHYIDHVQVNSISLEEVLRRANSRIDLLILNCEGSELPIMRSLYDEETRKAVAQICVSFHDPRIYNTGKKMEILARLKPFYHIERGTECPGIPDYLLIRKV